MSIRVTEEASEILRRSLALGKVDRATGGIRLRGARSLGGGYDVQVELAAGPEEGDITEEHDGIRIFVEAGVLEEIPNPVLEAELQHDIVKVLPG